MNSDFHKIYEEYSKPLYLFILRMCGNEQLAKDILQDTMLKAMTSAEDFRGGCSVKTWLCTIARNLYYDHLKKADNNNLLLESAGETADSDDIEKRFADRDMALRIHSVLHKLDEPYREVFTLRVFAELKYSDIARVFGKSENWAGVTFYRAKQILIKMLKEEGQL